MSAAGRAVAIVMYGYPLGVSAMIVNTARMFAARGWGVDIFIDRETLCKSPVQFEEADIRVVPIVPLAQESAADRPVRNPLWLRVRHRAGALWQRLAGPLTGRLCRTPWWERVGLLMALRTTGGAERVMSRHVPALFRFCQALRQRATGDYRYLIGVEPQGLVAARYCGGTVPGLIYFNMELLQAQSCRTPAARCLKALEIDCLRRSSGPVVLQNRQRAGVFLREHPFCSPARVRLLPVAALGPPHRARSAFFREMFSIPAEKKIVLYAGNFARWAMCAEMARAVSDWDEEYVLVIHTWRPGVAADPYFQEVQRQAPAGRVFFSLQALDPAQLDAALSSADAGLLFYRPIDENFTAIEFSSNKLAQYMKAGLPVVCSDFPGLVELVEGNRCGACVAHPQDAGAALRTIFSDYEAYRRNVFACYENQLEFSAHFAEFYNSLEDAARTGTGSDSRCRPGEPVRPR